MSPGDADSAPRFSFRLGRCAEPARMLLTGGSDSDAGNDKRDERLGDPRQIERFRAKVT